MVVGDGLIVSSLLHFVNCFLIGIIYIYRWFFNCLIFIKFLLVFTVKFSKKIL
jgi:hypothetical protein